MIALARRLLSRRCSIAGAAVGGLERSRNLTVRAARQRAEDRGSAAGAPAWPEAHGQSRRARHGACERDALDDGLVGGFVDEMVLAASPVTLSFDTRSMSAACWRPPRATPQTAVAVDDEDDVGDDGSSSPESTEHARPDIGPADIDDRAP